MGPIWQAQLGESLVMLIGPSWEPNLLPYWLPNFCSAIRATLGQRQIRQSPGLALNAHSGNEWGKIPVLTGFPSPSILGVFHSLLSAIGFQSSFFFTADVDPPLTHFLGEFPGLGLALVPDVVVPQAEQRCTWSRKLDPNFCPGWGRTSDPWHLAAADVATRLSRTSPYIIIYKYIYIYNGGVYLSVGPTVFRGPRNFEPSRGIWVFTAELGHGIRLFAAEFDVFHSNNYFFTKKDLKVAL